MKTSSRQSLKLALGTVQFGLDYGVSNNHGQVPPEVAAIILSAALKNQIGLIDTASAYGSAEKVLGQTGLDGFQVVSKFADLNKAMNVKQEFSDSLEALGLKSLYGYLVHDCNLLLDVKGDALFRQLSELKNEGLVQKIGVSVYRPEELVTLDERYDLDLVQLPCNALDNRWDEKNVYSVLQKDCLEVHVRSAFLQGLLLMEPDQVSPYFAPWKPLLQEWQNWCKEQQVSPVEACIGSLMGKDWISKLVVGVTTVAQLEELVAAAGVRFDEVLPPPKTEDEGLLNPARWQHG